MHRNLLSFSASLRLCGKLCSNQKGVSIIAVVAAMLILSVMGVTLISLVTTGSDVSINQLYSEQAFNVAEGGKEYILANKIFPSYSLPAPGVNLGAGNFTVATPAYLTAGIDSVVTTIPVDSTSKFPGSGRIIIDSELIDYTGTTPTSFTPATRGAGAIISSIAFDASSSVSGSLATLTWAHTVGAGSNRILVVGVSIRNNASQTVTGVTYGVTPLTLVGSRSNTTRCRVEIWSLVAPATGTNNITVTLSAAANAVGGAVSLTGVDQTTPIDAAFVSAVGNSTTPSRAITTVTNNAWVIDVLAAQNAPVATVGAGQTQRWNASVVASIVGAGSTEGPKTPVGAVTMSWSLSAAERWATGAVAIRPASSGGSTATTHAPGNAVYPVTTLTADPGAAGATISVISTTGFDIPGVIKIDSEYIYCASTNTPLTTQFTGCIRGYNGSTAATHALGSNIFQYIAISTGTVGNSNRVVKVGVDAASGSIDSIAFDASSSSSGDNVSTLTWPHTVVAAGTNRILVVGVSIRGTNPVTTVTYAGTPLTLVGFQDETTNSNARVEIWSLVAPAVGANNIVVTFAGNTRFIGGAVSLTGVNQSTPIDAAFVGAFGNSLAPSVAVTTVTNNAWVIDTLAARNAPVATVGAGQTQRWNTSIATRITGAGSTEGPNPLSGAVTMNWTLSVARDWALGAVTIRPQAVVTTLTHEEVY